MSYGSMVEKAEFSCGFHLLLTLWTLISELKELEPKCVRVDGKSAIDFYWFWIKSCMNWC